MLTGLKMLRLQFISSLTRNYIQYQYCIRQYYRYLFASHNNYISVYDFSRLEVKMIEGFKKGHFSLKTIRHAFHLEVSTEPKKSSFQHQQNHTGGAISDSASIPINEVEYYVTSQHCYRLIHFMMAILVFFKK